MQKSSVTRDSEQILSVSELNASIQTILSNEVPPCWLRGEVSNLRNQSSGHLYFTLKDHQSQISAVLFKGYGAQLPIPLAEGKQILVFGNVSVYEPRGQYQFIVRYVIEDGQGKLQLEFNRLKNALAAEGLFDAERKRPIPTLPKTIGIVTSPTGAAIQDFISILSRRNWKGTVIVFPSKVQGADAAKNLIEQLHIGSSMPEIELLVIGRGGGSIEDLWCFNDEALVRAVTQTKVPIISAVGHEIDFVLTDFAADKRAETPSAAAELISSHYIERLEQFERAKRALDPTRFSHILENYALKLDDKENRLERSLQDTVSELNEQLSYFKNKLEELSPGHRLQTLAMQLDQFTKRLNAADPHNILNRGFAWLQDNEGNFIEDSKSALRKAALTVTVKDGSFDVRIE